MPDLLDELLPDYDEKRTIENARHFLLRDFPRLQRMAHLSVADLHSPSMDGLPKAPIKANSADEPIIKRLDAKALVQAAYDAINACSATSRYILIKAYVRGHGDTTIYLDLHMGRSQYFVHKQTALLEFAFAFQSDYDLVVRKT
ncbi:ArpU family phage packaging/lysis transcriptional regulator [Secundilactobacillus kimchicus]|uniref:ArpU family phage packaging/lysis transcriptional regulator n=1 Tax=Secundilactobacillus kimchicus TaxID=528209 RepID=UPI0024A80051|nr:ArpU family phage packaging/lysis transcriptional regulator [Secundilactobacillus kimchicus]